MEARYLQLVVDLPESGSEQAQDLLHEGGALGLEIRDSEAPPMPGVRAPETGEAIVIGFFDTEAGAVAVQGQLKALLPAARTTLEAVPNQDWSNSWKSLIRPTVVGRLWVGPPWERDKAPSDKTHIVIEPKMAFGTGDHPTTRLCLSAIDEFLTQSPNASVLDVGTGSGVLAIAAQKLGAAQVIGLDNDRLSVELARENAQVNGTPEITFSLAHPKTLEGNFDLVIANILANTLIELALDLVARVKGRLVLAGVLERQRDEVAAAFLALGLRPLEGAREGEWVRLDFARTFA